MRGLSIFRRFASDHGGNIAILFGLAVIPVVGAMGVALDYSFANAGRTAMQAALDNTALALSKMMPLSQTQLNDSGWKIFKANLGTTPLTINQADLIITPTTNTLSVQINAQYPIRMASVLSKYMPLTIPLTSKTKVVWGNTRLRVALVLDNTGSMSQSGKIGALQTATTNLITTLQGVSTTNGDVYISIIPFSRDVNIGASNYSQTWIDWTDWNSINGTCSNHNYTTQSGCTSHNKIWTANNHNTWNGCVTDRGTDIAPGTTGQIGYDQKVDLPVQGGNRATLFPADQYAYCTLAMMGLSYDWAALKNLVSQMTPNGSTNQPIGLVWGWQSLVGGGPLTAPAFDPNYQYNQVIILLSDGLNTQDRWYGDGSNTSTDVDSRMYYNNNGTISGTCKNIKDAGIQVYTVQVNTGGDPTSTLLQNCASNPGMFFMLTSANEIVTTFDQIGTALANLHLSQ